MAMLIAWKSLDPNSRSIWSIVFNVLYQIGQAAGAGRLPDCERIVSQTVNRESLTVSRASPAQHYLLGRNRTV
jgi:hypothetical protein